MSKFKIIFAFILILLMVTAIVRATISFDNGNELQAIFDMTTMAFTVSFWAWLLILLR